MLNKRVTEKEVWDKVSPYLDLPPTTVNGEINLEGKRRYFQARRSIAHLVNDPQFVQRFQQHQLSVKEILFKDFPSDVFAKLAETDIRALVPDKKKH